MEPACPPPFDHDIPRAPRPVYLDNNATTACAPEVVEAMVPFFGALYGNPSSAHSFGGQVGPYVTAAREAVARLAGCDASEVIFTSGGTEADCLAILGATKAQPGRRHILSTRVEHPAVLNTLSALGRQGYDLTCVPPGPDGRIDPSAIAEAIRPDQTALISCMWANNETGVVLPVAELAALAHANGIPFHTDAVQAAGKVPIDCRATEGLTLLSLAAHKLHGPKGTGALIVRGGTRLEPCLFGGHQESGIRPGTENIPGIIGLGVACAVAGKDLPGCAAKVGALRDRFETAVFARIPGVWRNGHPTERTPNTANLGFEGVEGQGVLLLLDNAGIAASAGSACSAGSMEPSHVLRAMGLDPERAGASIRFSLSRYTTAEELDWTVEALVAIIEKLRTLRPYRDPAAIAAYREAQGLPVG